MELTDDEIGGLVEAESEYVNGFLETMTRALPQMRAQLDDMKARHMVLLMKLRAEQTKRRTPQALDPKGKNGLRAVGKKEKK